MSISTLQSTIQSLGKELAQLEKDLSAATKKESDKRSKISQIDGSITKSTSPSMVQSKRRDISRLLDEISRCLDTQSTIQGKIADRRAKLHKAQEDLRKEQEKLQKKNDDEAKRNNQMRLKEQKDITQQLREQYSLSKSFILPSATAPARNVDYDVFISHATEDKDEFVRPLTIKLQELGFKVWYDEFTIKLGDSLRQSIDKGLANARYGVVVLSSAFFSKNWPQYELNGLVAREMQGRKVILPIWHRVTKDEVVSYSPTLADKLALNSSIHSIEEIASQLSEVLNER
jgi:hypothetical protein